MAALPASTAPLAAALITGERGALGRDLTETLRLSGLAHLLAILGLHMALFAGGVFWVVRALLALSSQLAVTRPIKKWAALAAIASGFFYLLISGMGLATQRAFIMITIMLVAVLIDRPALTMRNVALAAWVILLARAESIMSVSFQMSFMAVVCLVGVYAWRAQVKAHRAREYTPGILASAWRYGAGLMLTTLVAGAATAPIVGALVMPMAVLALVFMPFGLEAYPSWVMGQGLDIVLVAATWVADLGGAVRPLTAMPLAAPVAMVAGLLWLSLWQRAWRLAGWQLFSPGFGLRPVRDCRTCSSVRMANLLP
jgi:competence protein ComEC